MPTVVESKPCQANDDGITCEKDARAKCFHCSRDLCLIHLTEHTQFIERQTRTNLYSYEKILNDLSNKLDSLSISSRVLEYPFIQLEKWRTDAHKKLDELAEQKRLEIEKTISEYRMIFAEKNNEQKRKIELLKKQLNSLSRQTQVVNKDIKYLDNKIEEAKLFLQLIEKHSIRVSTYAFFVNIRTNLFDSQPSRITQSLSPKPVLSTNSIRNSRSEFKELVSHRNKQRIDKKRSLSVSLL